MVELRLEVPAILALETGKPLSLLASQAMIFFEPIAQALFPGAQYRRYAALAEKRDAIETLIRQIESCSERARAERQAEKTARQRPR